MRYQFKSLARAVFKNMFQHFSDRELTLHLIQRIENMSRQLDSLKSDVAQNTTVVGSAIVLLTSLAASLKAAILANQNGDDGEALSALSTSLEASTAQLAQAVAANTPSSTVGDSSASTPVHPSTDLPATPNFGSGSDSTDPDPREPKPAE